MDFDSRIMESKMKVTYDQQVDILGHRAGLSRHPTSDRSAAHSSAVAATTPSSPITTAQNHTTLRGVLGVWCGCE